MSQLRAIIADLREKRLWPVAVALVVALVAVPVLLSSGSSATPVAQLPTTSELPAPAGVPVVSSTATPSEGKLTGRSRNPFNQLVPTSTTGTSTTSTTGTGSTSGKGTSTNSTTATTPSTGTSTTSGGTGTTTTTTTTIPVSTPKPAPTGLTATQSYAVKLAITNSSGGLNTIDPLERLSVLPSGRQPLLVELGVLKGGSRVLFAVQPGTVVGGPGSCIPGPIDCEILSLAQDQVEALGVKTQTGNESVALFAVTGITAAGHSSAAAANKARGAASSAGRQLLSGSSSSALSLYQYEPSVGALVDLQNLTVGGS